MISLLNTATLLGLVVSVVIPALSSLLAKQHWPAELVGLLTLALATANGFCVEWARSAADNHAYDWKRGLLTALGSYVVAVVSRSGIWRGTAADQKLLSAGSRKHPHAVS